MTQCQTSAYQLTGNVNLTCPFFLFLPLSFSLIISSGVAGTAPINVDTHSCIWLHPPFCSSLQSMFGS